MAEPVTSEDSADVLRENGRPRPRLHFTPPVNWLNDPNGLIRWGGRYHLFYQHNPHQPWWGRPAWGHAVSDDFLRWTDLPIALAPTDPFDAMGCYSGSCVDDDGVPTILYTAVSASGDRLVEQVHLATSEDDDLLRWRKDPEPVITTPPGFDLVGFRDPHVRRLPDGRWHLVLGAGVAGGGGAVLGYVSDDLRRWELLGVLLDEARLRAALPGLTEELGAVWECPLLLPAGHEHVLVLSVWDGEPSHVVAVTGRLDGAAFLPRALERLDLGASFYAPHALVSPDGRVDLVGWLRETAGPPEESGWVGLLSLPRTLAVRDGRLHQTPAPPAERLRAEPVLRVTPGRADAGLQFAGLDAAVEVEIVAGTSVGVRLCDAAGEDVVVLRVDDERVRLAGLLDVPVPTTGPVRLIVDVGVVELFVEGAPPATLRLPDGVRVAAGRLEAGPDADLTVWRLALPPDPGPRRPDEPA